MDIDGEDCGYLDAEGVACSEMRASFATACGKLAKNEEEMWDCMHYHAKWAVDACFPSTEEGNAERVIERAKKWCHEFGLT
jgi:hypothetical protein